MNNLNLVIMHGNLVKDPETQELSTGPLTTFTIASDRKYKDTDETCFINVQAWGKLANLCNKYLSKGSPVLVEGRLKLEQWEHEGKRNSRHVIIAEKVISLLN